MAMKNILSLLVLIALSTTLLQGQTTMNIHQSNGTVIQLPLNTIDSITYTISGSGDLFVLNCSGATNQGALTAGTLASGVSSTIAYTGGNGGSYSGQMVSSTGVTGLTATLAGGTFAMGAGSVVYTITGTPSMSGTAIFALSLGGQNCTLARTISPAAGGGGTAATCGAPNIHNPDLTYGTMTDQEGNTYKTIVIGTQEWMAENLNTSIYRNGDAIPTNLDNAAWQNTTSGAWAYYNNDASYACPYGKLYNWYTCVDSRQLCPTGWHVPTDAEWTVLTDYLGGEIVSGGKMKTTGTIEAATGLWYSPNAEATNSSGFSGAPGGFRYDLGVYYFDEGDGLWWSSSESGADYAWYRGLYYNDGSATRDYNHEQNGFSVRCLRDDGSSGQIYGCTNNTACNYNSTATQDDGSCHYIGSPCNDGNSNTFDDVYNESCVCEGSTGQISGCTNNTACNYNSTATQDDGSCHYIGSPCNDGNSNTFDDVYNESCVCEGSTGNVGSTHTCGAPNIHNPDLTYGTMTDQEGNVYKTIVIGTQEWMAENLNTSIYRNGDAIPTNLDDAAWQNTTSGAWAYYNNDASYACPYGKLYNWYTCVDARQLCPTGWHVPTDPEWTVLTNYLGGQGVAGGKMKTSGIINANTGLWYMPNAEATNSSGFSGAPGWQRYSDGGFDDLIDYYGFWWSSSVDGTTGAWRRYLGYDNGVAGSESDNKRDGVSVRCLRDDGSSGQIYGCTNNTACNYNSTATQDDGSCHYIGSPCNDGNSNTFDDVYNESCVCGGTAATCGAPNIHNPDLTYGTMTDQEGNTYKTIVIGTQEWMAENLNTSIYRNGDAIPTSLDNAAWQNTTSGAWAYYNNGSSYACPYGKLYNWYTCVDARQLCPTGWHVPTDAEWTVLTDYLGGAAVAGGKMKTIGNIEAGTGLWYSPNVGPTNSSGFAGVPGGSRFYDGTYNDIGNYGFWWSSSDEEGSSGAWSRGLVYEFGSANSYNDSKYFGFSVRCLRD
jgi:uncharacterized protein (TIGR02145 family)